MGYPKHPREGQVTPDEVAPGERLLTARDITTPELAEVRMSGKTATRRGPAPRKAVPAEVMKAMRKTAMHAGRDTTEQRPTSVAPTELEIPMTDGTTETMIAADVRLNDRQELKDAPPPPPGYRYNLVGRLVPLIELRIPLTDPKGKALFLDILELTGSARTGLDALGIASIKCLQSELARDAAFNEAYDVALERHRDRIYAAARHRAVEGYEVPIVGGRNKDEIVAYERKYSDNIMMLMLKRHFPEFREAGSAAGPKITVNTDNRSVNVTGVDVTKLDREQRKKLRDFLESLPAADRPAIMDASSTEKETK